MNLLFYKSLGLIRPITKASASSHFLKPMLGLSKSITTRMQHTVFTKEELLRSEKERLKDLEPYLSKLPAKVIPYAELMRLEKPAGAWLLYIPCTWSILIASMETMAPIGASVWALFFFGAGSLVMRGAGCTINDLLDRNLDSKVIRSVQRPIASGRVTPARATAFLAAQTAVGVGLLSLLPPQCWWLGLASLPIAFTYPLFKRFTYYPQIVLSSCFTWGALLGFPAMGITDWSTMLPLYGSSFLWCMTYDTIYAHQDKKFDAKAGVKSTALKWGTKTKKILTGMSVAQLGLLSLAGINAGIFAGPGFLVGLGIFSYRLIKMIYKVNLDDPKDCWKWFVSNIKTGLILTASLFFDYLLMLSGFL